MVRKILYISSQSEIVGGGQRSFLGLLENLDRNKFFPVVIFTSAGEFAKKIAGMKIPIEYCSFPRLRTLNIIRIIKVIFELKNIIKRNKIDLVHTDAPRETFFGGLVCRWMGVPLVWHIRVGYGEKFWDWLLFYLATTLVSVSKFAVKRFVFFPNWKRKIKVIYSGIEIKDKKMSPEVWEKWRSNYQIHKDAFLVGVAGQIIPRKGIEDILHIADSLAAVFPLIKFVVAGHGDEKYLDYLKTIVIRKKLAATITFIGFLENMDIFYQSIDLFVLVSYFKEGLPRSVLEALAAGRPVISYNCGGAPEAIEENKNGFLVPVGNFRLIQKRIVFLSQNPHIARKMGVAGEKTIGQKFSVSENIRNTEAVYEELLNNA